MSSRKIEVLWDGTRVIRVPSAAEVEVLVRVSQGSTLRQVATRMYMSEHAAQSRVVSLVDKMAARNPAHALHRMYSLGLLPDPRNPRLTPLLDEDQRRLLELLTTHGLGYARAGARMHPRLGRNQTGVHARRMFETLGATNRVQAVHKAVERGDMKLKPSKDSWRGHV